MRRYRRDEILAMGRGASEQYGMKAETVMPYDVVGCPDHGEYALRDDMFYVDAYGNVWPSCDLSYEYMREHPEHSIGNVTDPDFDWYDAALAFNVRNEKSFPIVAVEPGCENYYDYRANDVRAMISSDRIKRMNEKIKEAI